MKTEHGQITVLASSTGNKTPILEDYTLDIQAVALLIASSATESAVGFYDGTKQFTGSSAYKDSSTTRSITHYRNIGGVKTKVFEGTVTNLDIGEFTINVTTCTQNTALRFVAYGS